MPEDRKFLFSLCLITDFSLIPEGEMETVLASAIRGGVDIIQFRDNNSSPARTLERAERVKRITSGNVPLIVNSDPDLLKRIDADGLQVKSGDLDSIPRVRKQIGTGKYIGASVHNKEELLLADKLKADFLILGPMFPPGSKPEVTRSLGEANFRNLCSLTTLPVLGLGGISLSNAEVPILCGAQGVSMITGLLRETDIYRTAKEIREKMASFQDIFASPLIPGQPHGTRGL